MPQKIRRTGRIPRNIFIVVANNRTDPHRRIISVVNVLPIASNGNRAAAGNQTLMGRLVPLEPADCAMGRTGPDRTLRPGAAQVPICRMNWTELIRAGH